uniref:Uncharacterized protein n=1 Tax=Candidatus Kentrum sp. LPFa TaxID=2126335 RepID=A0A450W5I4_9GAMM|nr:MAG: hypothetical protein BECKLPF1236B_GA0070989_103323 [Candidatus Kentron sp. LPFa]
MSLKRYPIAPPSSSRYERWNIGLGILENYPRIFLKSLLFISRSASHAGLCFTGLRRSLARRYSGKMAVSTRKSRSARGVTPMLPHWKIAARNWRKCWRIGYSFASTIISRIPTIPAFLKVQNRLLAMLPIPNRPIMSTQYKTLIRRLEKQLPRDAILTGEESLRPFECDA